MKRPITMRIFLALLYCLSCTAYTFCGESGVASAPYYLNELEQALEGSTGMGTGMPLTGQTGPQTGTEPRAIPVPGVSGRQPSGGGMLPSIRARVTAERHTILSSQSTGRVVQVSVRDGDRFSEGDTLVHLDPSLLQLHSARAEAAYQRQEVLYQMNRELADMHSKGEAEVEASRMDMEQAKAEMDLVAMQLNRTRVTAPWNGRVADLFVRENQYVTEGQPLLEILDDSTLELEFIVSSHWVGWFKPGFGFKVTVEETGREYEAIVQRIGGKVDPLSQSMKAYATLTNPSSDLMEGMSGTVDITPPDRRF